jgi:hypothetical protein
VLVPYEIQVADEGPLGHHEGELHPAFEILHLGLHVVEEAQREDGANIVSETGGNEGAADLGGDPPEDDRFLNTAIALHSQLLDHDLSGRGGTGGRLGVGGTHGRAPQPGQGQGKKNGESVSPLRAHGSWANGSSARRPSAPPAQAAARRPGSRGR